MEHKIKCCGLIIAEKDIIYSSRKNLQVEGVNLSMYCPDCQLAVTTGIKQRFIVENIQEAEELISLVNTTSEGLLNDKLTHTKLKHCPLYKKYFSTRHLPSKE